MPNAIPAITTPPTSTLADTLIRQGAAGPGGKLGKDEFLHLLTTQLRYQDPLNPMDGHQLAADLAQFSGLEQLLGINDALMEQSSKQDVMLSAINNSVALSTIGKTVEAAGDQVVVADDGTGTLNGKIVADISNEGSALLELLDDSGRVVGTVSLGHLKPAAGQEFSVADAAIGLTAGTYHARITVTDGAGAKIPQATFFRGRIDGLSYSPTGAVLTSGQVSVPIGSVRRIIG